MLTWQTHPETLHRMSSLCYSFVQQGIMRVILPVRGVGPSALIVLMEVDVPTSTLLSLHQSRGTHGA